MISQNYWHYKKGFVFFAWIPATFLMVLVKFNIVINTWKKWGKIR